MLYISACFPEIKLESKMVLSGAKKVKVKTNNNNSSRVWGSLCQAGINLLACQAKQYIRCVLCPIWTWLQVFPSRQLLRDKPGFKIKLNTYGFGSALRSSLYDRGRVPPDIVRVRNNPQLCIRYPWHHIPDLSNRQRTGIRRQRIPRVRYTKADRHL